MRKKLRDRIEKLAAERPVWLAFLVFVATAAIVVPVSLPFWVQDLDGFSMNVMSEAYGTLFDLLIIGWLLLWLNKLADRRQQKMRYREEIEDALGWRSPVASHRIVSNVRRLNRSGVSEGLELPEAYLKGASLESVKLNDSNLWGAHLEQASLREAQLSGSILAGANFEEADLESTRLEAADLRGANLRGADMERAHFEEADLRGANLEEADLQYAVMNGVGLERASLRGTNLRGATLTEADLDRATVHEANLTGVQLEGARLDGADFTGAQLREADLRGASLKGTIFRAADLTGVHLTEEDIDALGAVQTLYEAALDDALRERLQEAHPHLFEGPDGETSSVLVGGADEAGGERASAEESTGGSEPVLANGQGQEAQQDATNGFRPRPNGRRTVSSEPERIPQGQGS